jgi:YegS/Rv2252/BmrU family lipid kinase
VTPAPTDLARARRVLVIANPAAGTRRGRPVGELAARAAKQSGCAVTLARTEQPGDARRLAASAASADFDLVLVAGGDGTVNEAANGLLGSAVALGVAPAGTMNLLARVLGLPLDPAQAVSRIIEGYLPRALKPGVAGGRAFLLMAGAGFDAWVLRELLRVVSAKIGFGDYVRGAIRGLRTFPFPRLTIDYDGGCARAHTAIVGRAPLYGGFLRPTPHARLDVDALEMCAIDGGAARLAVLLPRLWSGAHAGCPGITLVPVHHVVVATPIDDVPYHLDGEIAGTLPVAVGLSERNLVLATPRRSP